MSSQVKQVQGRGLPLPGNDIDTDRIIPARFLRCVTFDGLGKQVFLDDRKQAEGNHPFDKPEFQGAKVLAVNANFGCGSSREHAPQAIARWGIEAIVGESFAEIFFGNCVAMGVPCVTAPAAKLQELQAAIEADPMVSVSVNLDALTVTAGNVSFSVSMPEGSRQMLLTGTWDTCGQLVANGASVRETAAALPYTVW